MVSRKQPRGILGWAQVKRAVLRVKHIHYEDTIPGKKIYRHNKNLTCSAIIQKSHAIVFTKKKKNGNSWHFYTEQHTLFIGMYTLGVCISRVCLKKNIIWYLQFFTLIYNMHFYVLIKQFYKKRIIPTGTFVCVCVCVLRSVVPHKVHYVNKTIFHCYNVFFFLSICQSLFKHRVV